MNKELELFRKQKPLILTYIKTHGIHKVSEYCATTMIPLIVVYTYILEDLPEYKELAEKSIKSLKEFYGIK